MSEPPHPPPRRGRRLLRGLALMGAGALLALALAGGAFLLDLRSGGRLARAAMGAPDLAEACRAPLLRRLAERGFEPDDLLFGPEPTVGPAFERARTFGDSFTFRDGALGMRVDGVVACALSGGGTTVDVRVASDPRRLG